MNAFVGARYAERIERLALGIEPVDTMRRLRIVHSIEVAVEGPPPPDPLTPELVRFLTGLLDRGGLLSDNMARAPRHASCRHVLLFKPPLKKSVDLRLLDRTRRFVPRRLRIPLEALSDPTDPMQLDVVPLLKRSRFPALFPGAAYDVTDNGATGVRGRVVRDDPANPGETVPVRWPRIEARRNGAVVGRAHGDQDGEFLLLLESIAVPAADLPVAFVLDVEAFAPPPLALPPALVRAVDPLWDLPLETAAAPGVLPEADSVMTGEQVPASYTKKSGPQPVTFTFGAIVSGIAPFKPV